jgi:hypothetical protein
MVHDDIKQNTNAAFVRLLDQRMQFLLGAHVGVEFGPV